MSKDTIPKFDEFNPLYDNTYEKVGPEFGELQAKKEQFVEENAGRYALKPDIPQNIAGLLNRGAQNNHILERVPSTMRWFRRTTSFERNGHFNVQTPIFNTRFSAWFFFIWLGWGWSSFQVSSYNAINQQDGRENVNQCYDKLSIRAIPPTKLWNRPG